MTSGPVDDPDGSAALLAAAADPVRWTVLQLLAQRQSCVCDLQAHIPIAPNLLSYHLKMLREAGLIVGRRRGRWIDYSLADGALARLHDALPAAATPSDREPVESSATAGCVR
jgi:ArsR family transcriptional regulator